MPWTNLGLWRSTDEGDHWQFIYDAGEIKGMFIDNQDNGRLYIATENEIVDLYQWHSIY